MPQEASMRNLFAKTLVLTAGAVMYSHAIFGIGGHWAPSPGMEVKSSTDTILSDGGANNFIIKEGGVTGLQGFGLKIWIDALPFIDLEATSNIQFGAYDLTILGPTGADTTAVKFDLGVPLAPDKPMFARIVSDVSILYPFLKFPPAISIVKLYAGAGISHVLSTKVLDAAFAQSALKDFDGTETKAEVADKLTKAIVDEGLSSGFGFHLIVGAKAKAPVIPIALYANIKYGFGGSLPKSVSSSSMTLELGGGLAF
jgi:hypothetical protein